MLLFTEGGYRLLIKDKEKKLKESAGSIFWLWFRKSILFCVMYVVLSLLFGGLLGVPAGRLLLYDRVTDLGAILIAVLSLYLMVTVFACFASFVSKDAGRPQLLLATLIPLFGFALYFWVLGMQLSNGDARELWSQSWLWYSLNQYWANPILKVLSAYEAPMQVMTLIFALVPCISMMLGILLQGRVMQQMKGLRKLLTWSAFPLLVVITLVVSILVPKGTLYTADQYPRIDGATAAIPFAEKLRAELTGVNRMNAAELTRFSTTHYAYLNLIEGHADLIFVAGPSDDEMSTAEKNGVELELHSVGRDAFIFLVNDKNPVSVLSTEQIQDIYGGFITNWSEVGGENRPILALQREANSGSQTFMETGVMADTALTEVPKEQKVSLMSGLIDRVAEYNNEDNAIGYSFHFYASEMYQKDNVKFLAIDGVMPNKDSIRSGEYPYAAEIYAVTRSDLPQDHAARQIVKWLQGEEGQQVVEEGGFIAVGEDK